MIKEKNFVFNQNNIEFLKLFFNIISEIMSTVTLETRKAIIRFYDPLFDHDNDKYTDVTIKVERKRYANKKEFFYIDYKYKYSPKNVFGYEGHPFLGTVYEESKDGDIVAANFMTETMINYLLMDTQELSKICGNVTPRTYKVSIMHALTNFWD